MIKKIKIILVDDDPKFQKLIRPTLAKHGLEVTVCNDGISALEVIKHNPN